MRVIFALVVGSVCFVGGAGCLNDYDEFDFSGADSGASPGGSGGGGAGGATSCSAAQQLCDGACVSKNDRRHCGACGNDCTALGVGAGFICSDGACGCGLASRCGQAPAACRTAGGPCECGGRECRPGEACEGAGGDQTCACEGGDACGGDETCCPGAGCKAGGC